MKSFVPAQLGRELPMGLAWLAGSVMECRGRQSLYEQQKPEALSTLRELAIIQSAESSNRIEGVTVESKRLRPLVLGKVEPKDRSEHEIVGYRRALDWIHRGYDDIEIAPETLKALHRMAQQVSGDAGEWKARDTDIIEILPSGRRQVRFRTVPAAETPEAVAHLCLAYGHTVEQADLPPLLPVANFVLDFLCIHPFRDGNGRVARLLTLLLLYHHGFRVGRYVSLERIVEETKESYYEALRRASSGWHEARHDPTPWWSYFLSTVRQAYRVFEERVEELGAHRGTKTETVEMAIQQLPERFAFGDLAALCPNVSRELIRRTLRRLRDAGRLECFGTGRGAKWRKVDREKAP